MVPLQKFFLKHPFFGGQIYKVNKEIAHLLIFKNIAIRTLTNVYFLSKNITFLYVKNPAASLDSQAKLWYT